MYYDIVLITWKKIRAYGRGAADALNKHHINIIDVYKIYPVIKGIQNDNL